MKDRVLLLQHDLGPLGMAAFALLAAAGLFFVFVLQPLERRNDALQDSLARQESPGGPHQVAGRLEALYEYLDRGEETTDWLAKLHAIGRATGVQMRSATYRTQAVGARLERYEIVLPVSGSYSQVREFLKRALADIPVLSLDQLSLKRERRTDGHVQAELRLSLHRVRKAG